ncbi:MAG: glucosyltransferase domain-containing protein [Faecousia sp.]
MKSYWEELRGLCTKKRFLLCIALLALVAYGFSVANSTMYIDMLENERYLGSGQEMLKAGRFGFTLLGNLVGYVGAVPQNEAVLEILTILGLILAGCNLCILFRRICGSALSDAACIVFIGVFLTYPLYIELWAYTGAMLCVSFCQVCSSYALLLIHGALHGGKAGWWKRFLPAALLMMLVCAGYEAIVPVYIWSVFAVLFLQAIHGDAREKTVKEMIRQGLCYAAVLVAGLALRVLVHKGILFAFHLTAQKNGETYVYWRMEPTRELIKKLAAGFLQKYLLKGIIYFPITEFVIACAAFVPMLIAACRRRGAALLLPGLGMYLSLILLSLLQAEVSPYRACHVFAPFVAFTVMYLLMGIEHRTEHGKRKRLRAVALCLCGVLCFQQARYINYFVTVNHNNAQEEAYVIREVGTKLQSGFDLEKPVFFVGLWNTSTYSQESASIPADSIRWKAYRRICNWMCELPKLGKYTEKPSRFLPQTIVKPTMFWAVNPTFHQEGMQHLFQYYGYDYLAPTQGEYDLLYEQAVDYVEQNQVPSYPRDGYIQDAGRYIVVHLERP